MIALIWLKKTVRKRTLSFDDGQENMEKALISNLTSRTNKCRKK